ncbi:hypothetical protein B224_0673 [Aeromonas media WS]|nr:hypothetical protein B224_0673 [Aeromonas media WS]
MGRQASVHGDCPFTMGSAPQLAWWQLAALRSGLFYGPLPLYRQQKNPEPGLRIGSLR